MTTDAQAALAQVREAIAAGPRPGEWRVSKYRDGRQALIYDADDFEVARVCYPNRDADAALIAACSPANMAAILAHVETQAAEIERLTAALQHEADCVEAAKEEIERLTAENKMLRHTHRWNVSPQVDDSLLVCRHLHEKDEKCDLEHYVPAERLHDAIRERDELRRQLDPMGEYASADELIAALHAEKAEDDAMKRDAERYRWLRPRFFAADFAYSDPPVCAIVFRWPESAKISANLDREIDAAMGASNE